MKEFIDKLIRRFEEEPVENIMAGKDYLISGNAIPTERVISIVKELAEEYNQCDLCYLGSPCEYQNENAMMPNELLADKNGWIACSERLPEEREYYLVSDGQSTFIAEYADYKWTYHCSDTDETYDCSKEVVAWCELPAPYTEGE